MDLQQAKNTCLQLLGRREYGTAELRQKLERKKFSEPVIDACLDWLQGNHYLSDQRFAASYVRQRSQKGYGPLRIRQELSHKGVDRAIVSDALEEAGIDWFEQAARVLRKKFPAADVPAAERQKQQRFLYYRGFAADHIQYAMEAETT